MGVGIIIFENNRNVASYVVKKPKELFEIVIPHFDKYPLITQKKADFLLFKKVVTKIYNREHLNKKGLEELVSLKASSNLGLSTKLKLSFPHIIPVSRPEIVNQIMPNLYWLVGFANGDGSFAIRKSKNSTLRHGYQYSLSFELSQHSRDIELFKSIKEYFGFGKVIKDTIQDRCRFFVTDFKDNQTKIIPIFQKYPMLGCKQLDFQDFCKAAEIIASKGHLTEEGIKRLDALRGGMNDSRAPSEK